MCELISNLILLYNDRLIKCENIFFLTVIYFFVLGHVYLACVEVRGQLVGVGLSCHHGSWAWASPD